MAERVTREQVESVRCEVCGAEPNTACMRNGRRLRTNRPHRERRQAFLDKQASKCSVCGLPRPSLEQQMRQDYPADHCQMAGVYPGSCGAAMDKQAGEAREEG